MNEALKKLLIVVDYQNDFVIGSCGFKKAEKIQENIVSKIKEYRQKNNDILFTLDTHFDESYEKNNYDIRFGWNLYGKIKEYISSDTIIISKHTFASVDLIDYLRKKQYDTVELAGVVTNICVLANAIISQTSLPDAKIIIDCNCTASNNKALYEKALDIMEGFDFIILNRK